MTTDSVTGPGTRRLAVPAAPAAAPRPSTVPVIPPQGSAAADPVPLLPRLPGLDRRHRLPLALLAADALAVAAAAVPAVGAARAVPLAGPVLGVLAVLHAAGGFYRPSRLASALDCLPRLLGHSVVAWCVVCALLAGAGPGAAVGGAALVASIGVQTLLSGLLRGALQLLRRRLAKRRPGSALVVGAPAERLRLLAALRHHPELGLRPVGEVGEEPGGDEPGSAPALPVLTSPQHMTRAVIQNTVRDVLIAAPALEGSSAALVRLCWEQGCTVWEVDAGDRPGRPYRPGPEHLHGFACRHLPPPPRRRAPRLLKRALDVAAAALGLLLVSPVLAACACAVRLDGGPGVIFRQERIGKDGRPFVMLKFRTLRPSDERESATRWCIAEDRRVSAVGRLLRRTSLDELPQLWNVLRGDMSLVGPRPERPHFVAQFSQNHSRYAERHRAPVGVTGLSQISGLRGDTSIADRARYDNHYIDSWSLWGDVCVMLRTTVACFRFGGS